MFLTCHHAAAFVRVHPVKVMNSNSAQATASLRAVGCSYSQKRSLSHRQLRSGMPVGTLFYITMVWTAIKGHYGTLVQVPRMQNSAKRPPTFGPDQSI